MDLNKIGCFLHDMTVTALHFFSFRNLIKWCWVLHKAIFSAPKFSSHKSVNAGPP